MNNTRRNITINFVISTTLAVIFGTAITTTNMAWADNINCTSGVTCNGTSRDDTMSGSAGSYKMFGLAGNDEMHGGAGGGNDIMSGGSGADTMFGNAGNDNMNGDSSDDFIVGGDNADILKGSSGNDKIFHWLDRGTSSVLLDGSKDTIDCGSGNDEAWINTSFDHDTAVNCETVHTR